MSDFNKLTSRESALHYLVSNKGECYNFLCKGSTLESSYINLVPCPLVDKEGECTAKAETDYDYARTIYNKARGLLEEIYKLRYLENLE